MATAKAKAPILDIPVTFGGVSFPDTDSGRIGIRIERWNSPGNTDCEGEWRNITLHQADKFLCGVQLVGRLMVLPEGVDLDQRHMFSDQCPEVEGTFTVKGFSVKPTYLAATLHFDPDQVDDSTIRNFAKKSGRLQVDLVLGQAENTEDEEGAEDAEVEDDDRD